MVSACCVWVLASAALLTSCARAAQEPPPGAPRCLHPQCRYLEHNTDTFIYEVAGNTLQIRRKSGDTHLVIECNRATVLESPALPRFEHAWKVEELELRFCPMPAAGSLLDAISTFNVTYCKPNALWCQLELYNVPPDTPPLTSKHFSGLGRALVLKIDNSDIIGTPPRTEQDFLKPLKSLQFLEIKNVALPLGALNEVPSPLINIKLSFTGTQRLPDAIYSLKILSVLIIEDNIPLDVGVLPLALQLALNSSATTLQLDSAPSLEKIKLHKWVEPLPPKVTSCNNLREIYLTAPAMRALPNFWLSSCVELKKLFISEARNLITLPANMLRPSSSYDDLSVTGGALETLHEDALEHIDLQSLQLNNNRIKSLPSNVFKKTLNIAMVDLSGNDLDGSVLNVLRKLEPRPKPSLLIIDEVKNRKGPIEVNLSRNPRIGDVCVADADGNSPLLPVTTLRKLDLSETGVSRICKDWRESMLELRELRLIYSKIAVELTFEDLQYKRDVRAQVLLQGAPITAVRITRENYNKIFGAPASITTMNITAEFDCDCRLYWARRVLEPPLHALDIISELRCVGGRLLRDLPSDDMVCGARGECVAADLPAGCECSARPDDDSGHDRWLVRTRCDKITQGLVPRRIYPFYPRLNSNSQAFYLTTKVLSF